MTVYVNGVEQRPKADYEAQAGIIAEPTLTARGNGHIVVVLYTMYDPDRTVTWKYANGAWYGTEDL